MSVIYNFFTSKNYKCILYVSKAKEEKIFTKKKEKNHINDYKEAISSSREREICK